MSKKKKININNNNNIVEGLYFINRLRLIPSFVDAYNVYVAFQRHSRR